MIDEIVVSISLLRRDIDPVRLGHAVGLCLTTSEPDVRESNDLR
jgi:hypothetical protein